MVFGKEKEKEEEKKTSSSPTVSITDECKKKTERVSEREQMSTSYAHIQTESRTKFLRFLMNFFTPIIHYFMKDVI